MPRGDYEVLKRQEVPPPLSSLAARRHVSGVLSMFAVSSASYSYHGSVTFWASSVFFFADYASAVIYGPTIGGPLPTAAAATAAITAAAPTTVFGCAGGPVCQERKFGSRLGTMGKRGIGAR